MRQEGHGAVRRGHIVLSGSRPIDHLPGLNAQRKIRAGRPAQRGLRGRSCLRTDAEPDREIDIPAPQVSPRSLQEGAEPMRLTIARAMGSRSREGERTR
eukprot:7964855-Alexandrium_andersonii.AAC.1